MLIESFAWFLMGAGAMVLIFSVTSLIAPFFFRKKKKSEYDLVIEELREKADEMRVAIAEANPSISVSMLHYRDMFGKLNIAKIIIDPSSSHDLAGSVEEDEENHTQSFIFSAKAAAEMRANGVELDEVVTKMLKASGRMP
jgi:hypothetical protein